MKNATKTKEQLIAELEMLQQKNAELHQRVQTDDPSVVRHRLAEERIRSEAMSMRTSQDLAKVVAKLKSELESLGIKSPWVFIVFIDEDQEMVTSYRANPNLKSFGVEYFIKMPDWEKVDAEWIEVDDRTIVLKRISET